MFDGVRQEPGMEDAGSWSDRPPRRNQRNQLIRQAWVRGRTVGEGAEAGFRREAERRRTLVVLRMQGARQEQSGEEDQDGCGAKGSHGHLSFGTTQPVVLP